MFERKITKELKSWKESLGLKRKALVIKGRRQIGKTFIAKAFAEEKLQDTSIELRIDEFDETGA